MPAVSVVIPSYNYGRFISEALASVFRQTYTDFEVIVVDDGSTDDTAQQVQAYLPRVRYIFQPHAGPSSARNTGIQRSRGKYIAFLDADDMWLPHKLERQVEVLNAKPDVALVYPWWSCIDERGAPLPQINRPTHRGGAFERLLYGCFVAFCMTMVRREVFDRIGLLDPALEQLEDWEILLRIASAGYQFGCVPEVLVKRRLHARNYGEIAQWKRFEFETQVLDRAFSKLSLGVQTEKLRQEVYQERLVSNAIALIQQGDWEKGTQLLGEGVRLRPEVLERPAFYVSLALNLLPYGYRSPMVLDAKLEMVTEVMEEILRDLFRRNGVPDITRRKRTAWSSLRLATAVLYGRGQRWGKASAFMGKAFLTDPLATGAVVILAIHRQVGNALRRTAAWQR